MSSPPRWPAFESLPKCSHWFSPQALPSLTPPDSHSVIPPTTLSSTRAALSINTNSDQPVLASAGILALTGNRVFTVTSVNSGNGENLFIKGDGSQNVVVNVNTPGDAQFHGNVILQDLTGKVFGDAGYAGL